MLPARIPEYACANGKTSRLTCTCWHARSVCPCQPPKPRSDRGCVARMTGLMRTWSWAASMADVEERRRHAQLMVGAVLTSVSYVTLDHERLERFPELELTGPRQITDPAEWADPQWFCPEFDMVDYGIELVMADGQVFSSTWDPPGDIEGIGLRAVPSWGLEWRPTPMLQSGTSADSDAGATSAPTKSRKWSSATGLGTPATASGAQPFSSTSIRRRLS